MPHENRLAQEPSPYLQQHRHNPVDWYPWGEEAFERAREDDKPIFLSIGYATCHWCHVMERESFEDEEAAQVLNEAFVCVKVDREERPDVDALYMTVCQMMTGRGGWPLTVLLTPDRRPFWAGTYLPKESRFGQMGLMDLAKRIRMNWDQARDRVEAAADDLTGTLRKAAATSTVGEAPGEEVLQAAYDQLRGRYDAERGGFGSAPKFPSPHNLLFLLRYAQRTGSDEALGMVEHTLAQMRRGGVYDQLGYGFHRYSTDARWLLPHFEKMLYDQAGLLVAYAEGYAATGREDFARTAREIAEYVSRDMTDDAGGFYSAEDADSEGREGAFYVWTTEDVREVLDADDANLFMRVYGFDEEGNFVEEATREKTGENIPHLTRPLAAWADELGTDEDELDRRLDHLRRSLFEHRARRERPLRDDKVLADWNGFMVAALAVAARALDAPEVAKTARRAADFVLGTMRRADGRLWHRYRAGEVGIEAHLDDYAFVIWGLVELYQTVFDPALLRAALDLAEPLLDHFEDEQDGGFFMAADDAEQLLVRQKEFYDGAMPSGNSAALIALVRLARLTGRSDLEDHASRIAEAAAEQLRRQPSGFTALLVGLDLAVGPAQEIVVAGEPGAADTNALLSVVREGYRPRSVVLQRPSGDEPELAEMAPFVREQVPVGGQATAYVCENFACSRPVTDADALRDLLATSR